MHEMTEYLYRAKIEDLARTSGLLKTGQYIESRLVNTMKFTEFVARALRPHGWGLHAKMFGLNIDNLALDRLVHKDTGRVAIILKQFATAHVETTWQEHAGGSAELYVDPLDPTTAFDVRSKAEHSITDVVFHLRALEAVIESHGIGMRRSPRQSMRAQSVRC